MSSRIGVLIGLVLLIVFGLYSVVRNGHDESVIPVYESDEATLFTHQHLPLSLQGSMSAEDVGMILELELAYMKKIGLVSDKPSLEEPEETPELDMEKMAGFIAAEAARRGRSFSLDEILEVLAAEDHYLRQEGIIEE
jgi:hypothetical protein